MGRVALTFCLVTLALACALPAGATAKPPAGTVNAAAAGTQLATPVSWIQVIVPYTYQVFQRDPVTGRGAIRITGKYGGTPVPVEASWSGGSWVTVDPHPSAGRFQGWIRDRAAGQGTLRVRFVGRPWTTNTHSDIGIGDIFVLAGGSNASGRAPTMQRWGNPTLVATMFGNNQRWQRLHDPIDSTSGQVDRVSFESRPIGGSVWPLLASHLMYGTKVPIAMIPVARGGSAMKGWQCRESDHDAPDTLYGNMLRRVRAAGGHIRAVLLWEGAGDAGRAQRTQPEYEALMRSFTNDVWRDLHVPVSPAQCGEVPWAHGTMSLDAVRAAQVTASTWTPEVIAGPQLYDILIHKPAQEDEVHYVTPAIMQTVSDRWWAALATGLYGRAGNRGPRLTQAVYDPATPAIDLTFAVDTPPLVAGGVTGIAFTVHDGSTTIPVTKVTQTGPGSLRLTLSRQAAAPAGLTVSLGEGHTGTLGPVPRDSGKWRLPAEWFFLQPVQVLASSQAPAAEPTQTPAGPSPSPAGPSASPASSSPSPAGPQATPTGAGTASPSGDPAPATGAGPRNEADGAPVSGRSEKQQIAAP